MAAPHDDPRSKPETWVCLGIVSKPFGVRGGVRINLHNSDSETLNPGLRLELRIPGKDQKQQVVVQTNHGEGRITFEGIHNRDRAEVLRNQEVWVRRNDFPALTNDETYLIDFLGAEVYSEEKGLLGEIVQIHTHTPQPLAQVKMPSGKIVEMPFVAGLIVGLSEKDKKVWIKEPEGLFWGEAVEATLEDETTS